MSTVTAESYRISLVSQDSERIQLVRRCAEQRLRLCTKLLGRQPTSILEVGAASGWFVRAFSDLGVRAMGIEIDPELVASAQRLGANVELADVCRWNTPVQFDVVWCSQTLEHITVPRIAVERMRAALVPGGLLELDVPNGTSWGSRLRRLLPRQGVYGAISMPSHQIAYQPRSLDRLLRSYDLEPLLLDERPTDDEVFGQVILPQGRFSRLAIMGSRLLGHGYLLVAVSRKGREGGT